MITIPNSILAYSPWYSRYDASTLSQLNPLGRIDTLNRTYFCNGLIGAPWGIIAGPIGIRMSYSNNLSRINDLWRAYIPLIFITMMGSATSCIMSIIITAKNYDGHSASHAAFPEYSSTLVGSYFIAISCIEAIISFGKLSCFLFVIMTLHNNL